MSPLDLIPEQLKAQLLDKGLTKLADGAERSGSPKLADRLRAMRIDTPFVEDVKIGLRRALRSFDRVWRPRDEVLTEIIMTDEELWCATDFLGSLAAALLRPTDESGAAFLDMKATLSQAVAGRVPEERIASGLAALLAAVREEMFAHPKLVDVHGLYLQRAMLNTQDAMLNKQDAMLEALQAIKQGLVSIDGRSQAQVAAPTPLQLTRGDPISESVTVRRAITLITRADPRRLPDVLTPIFGQSELIVPAYEPFVGLEAAQWLGEIQMRVTDSIERADFQLQQCIAEELIENSLGLRDLQASAYYLLGEAKRLQADFSDSQSRAPLLNEAVEAYGNAIELSGSIRATRGLGRIDEVRGDIGSALRLYGRARASALLAYADCSSIPDSEAAHEVLRSTRHYVACASQASVDTLLGAPIPHSKMAQLHGAIAESRELHYEILPGFAANNGWMQIEWFMGLVLLARANAVVGDHHQAWLCLAHALDARMGMMDPTRSPFSLIERGNLIWWLGAARAIRSPEPDFGSQLDMMGSAIESGDTSSAWKVMSDIVWPIRSPWLIRQRGI